MAYRPVDKLKIKLKITETSWKTIWANRKIYKPTNMAGVGCLMNKSRPPRLLKKMGKAHHESEKSGLSWNPLPFNITIRNDFPMK